MFKKFFRKIRDVAKKAAPLAGIAALGFGGAGLMGAGPLAGLLGPAGQGIAGLFAKGNLGSTIAKTGAQIMGGTGNPATDAAIAATQQQQGQQRPGFFRRVLGGIGSLGSKMVGPGGTPTALGGIASAVLPALAGYYAYSKDKPEPVDTNPMSEVDKRYGSQFGTGRFTDTLVKKTQYNPADGKYYDQISPDGIYSNYTPDSEKGLAMGGIIGLTKGGNPDYPRKQGMINGPGGPKDDMIPAMLSNGEFVFTAKAVDNAGGPRAMYNLMNSLDPESSKGRGGR